MYKEIQEALRESSFKTAQIRRSYIELSKALLIEIINQLDNFNKTKSDEFLEELKQTIRELSTLVHEETRSDWIELYREYKTLIEKLAAVQTPPES